VHLAAYTTLAVIYGRRGLKSEAEQLYRLVLDHEPRQLAALSNLVGLLRQQGREAEARPLQARLQALEAEPPYEAYRRGREAYARGDPAEARSQFLREIERHPEDHELHFWLALAELALGDAATAGRELEAARRSSTRPEDQARYAAKLQRLSEALRAMP
jgi:Flp pilus assembly protein TadD